MNRKQNNVKKAVMARQTVSSTELESAIESERRLNKQLWDSVTTQLSSLVERQPKFDQQASAFSVRHSHPL
jgi:hypothetical protein